MQEENVQVIFSKLLKGASEEVSSEVKGVGDSFMKDVNLDPEKPSESVGETKKESIVTSSGCEEDEVEM